MRIGRRVWLEIRVAVLNGAVCGAILGLIIGFWLSDYRLGAVVSISLIIVMLNSGLVGAGAPLILKRLNVDPALATGPFVTTSNDVFGLMIYLSIVTLFLSGRV
jgi:magnesium transporter